MTHFAKLIQLLNIQFARVIDLLVQPRRTLSLIVGEAATWQVPMLVLSFSSSLVVVVSGYFKARAAMMGELPLPRDWEWWTSDMQNNYMQAQQSMQGPVFTYIIPLFSSLLGLWLGWLILSGLLHLGSTVFGGRGSMQSALSITGWASLPFLVRDILRVLFMLIAGRSIESAGLSGFAGSSTFAIELLSRVDLFLIWSVVLLSIGFSLADNLPRPKAFANVFITTLLLLLAQAGFGVLFF